MAQVVATAHSVSSFAASEVKKEDSNNYYQEIFEQLIMCQSELTFSLDIIKNATKGRLRSEMSILFDESESDSSDSDSASSAGNEQ